MSSHTNFKPLFSSASDNHPTPQTFFDDLDVEFLFVLDIAASEANRKTDAYYGLDHPDPERRDGLATDWAADAARLGGAVWANIPYGRGVTAKWMAKAAAEAAAGATVVCLVPSRTGTRWFHEHVLAHDAEVRFVKGRLKFGDAKNSAPFDSLVIVFRPPRRRRRRRQMSHPTTPRPSRTRPAARGGGRRQCRRCTRPAPVGPDPRFSAPSCTGSSTPLGTRSGRPRSPPTRRSPPADGPPN